MKALTVWQPWASLIVDGHKPYEFRGWRAPRSLIGQRIVIHASMRRPKVDEIEDIFCNVVAGGKFAAMTCLKPSQELDLALQRWTKHPEELVLGAGLGTAIVGEPRNGLEIAEEFGLPRVNDSDRDEHANWGWPMLEIEKWDTPIPMKGAQGLWVWPTPEMVI